MIQFQENTWTEGPEGPPRVQLRFSLFSKIPADISRWDGIFCFHCSMSKWVEWVAAILIIMLHVEQIMADDI